ncbi:unnamed protein product, partial [Porites evermanni]
MELWFWILGWILSILTIAGNGFIIFLVCKKRQLRTKTNAFIASLAVADFCVGVSVVPSFFICDITGGCDWPTGNRNRPLWTFGIRWLFGYASVMNLCSLVLERYIAIVKPLKYLTAMTRCRVVKMIIFSWTIPIIFVVGLLLILSRISAMFFVSIFAILVEFFSCSILTFCTASIIHVVYKQDRAAPSLGKVSRFSQRREKSAIVMMIIVVGLFLICYGVYFRCSFAALFLNITCNDFSYKIPLFILNSAINPWAYALFKRDIKTMIKRLFC